MTNLRSIPKGTPLTSTELRDLIMSRAAVEAAELGLSEDEARTHRDVAFFGVKCVIQAAADEKIVFIRQE